MSLILEALKKSEAKRQLGAAPGLGTPFTVTRRRRSMLPLIVVVIVAAAAFGAWSLRRSPPSAPVAAGTAAAARTTANDRARTTAATVAAPARALPATGATAVEAASAGNTVTATTPPRSPPLPLHDAAVHSNPSVAAPGAPTDAALAAAREARRNAFARSGAHVPPPPVVPPAASVLPAGGTATNAAAHAGAVATPSGPAPAVAASERAPSHPAALVAPPAQAANIPHAPAPAPTPAAAPPAVPLGAVKPEPPAAPPGEHLPMYYELPYDIRKDLPALVVSMHVYGKDPAQRFVVVDGERKAEGDSIKEGLTLREIRNDGMVLEFRGQRFYYPRPGR